MTSTNQYMSGITTPTTSSPTTNFYSATGEVYRP